MKVKVCEHSVLFWSDGQLIWDDYVAHQQIALAPSIDPLLRWFATWKDLDSVAELAVANQTDPLMFLRSAELLLDAGILLEHGSPAHDLETRLAHWQPWGVAAKHFHFSSRSLSWTARVDAASDAQRLVAKASVLAPPPIYKDYPNTPSVPLANLEDDRDTIGFLDVLRRRRSNRAFDVTAPIQSDVLGAFLQLVAGGAEIKTTTGPVLLKTSPSGGARHPIEVYPCVRLARGIDPGLYHYSNRRHALELVRVQPGPDEVTRACGGQEYFGDAAVVLFYTAVLERRMWKYETARAYRSVLLDLGHLSQTAYLVATWLGLGVLFTGAVSDEDIEQLLDCDSIQEVALGASALGASSPDGAQRTREGLTGEGPALR